MSTTTPAVEDRLTGGDDERAVSRWYLGGVGLAQFGIFVAVLAPVFVSMQLKAQQLDPHDATSVVGTALSIGSIGSIGAIIGNPLFGALSDRTRTRWGRRRP